MSTKRIEIGMDYLQTKYPLAFNKTDIKPLAVGIYEQIRCEFFSEQPTGIEWSHIRKSLSAYFKSPCYRETLTLNAPRFDLKGKQVGEVTQEHFNIAEKKKAERLAQKKPKKKSTVAVLKSIAKQTEETKPRKPKSPPKKADAPAPVVVIKKRRKVVIPQQPKSN